MVDASESAILVELLLPFQAARIASTIQFVASSRRYGARRDRAGRGTWADLVTHF